MKRLKIILNWIVLCFILGLGVLFVMGTLEAWAARPYKKAFVEYQRASYHEAKFSSLQKDVADGKATLTGGKKAIRELQDSLTLAEENLFIELCGFPEKYQEYAAAASLIHEQNLNLRKYRAGKFKASEEKPFTQYDAVLDSIVDVYYDCSIIRKVESKKMFK